MAKNDGQRGVSGAVRGPANAEVRRRERRYDNSVLHKTLATATCWGIRCRRPESGSREHCRKTERERNGGRSALQLNCEGGWLAGGGDVDDTAGLGTVVVPSGVVGAGYRIVSDWCLNGLMTVTVSRRWASWRSSVSR